MAREPARRVPGDRRINRECSSHEQTGGQRPRSGFARGAPRRPVVFCDGRVVFASRV